MKYGFTFLLKTIITIIAVGTLAAMIRFPLTEGRATGLDLISIYRDPLVIYMYIAAIPFFVALFQAFKLVSYIEKSKTFSKAAIKAIRNIKYCAFAIIGLLIGAILYIRLMIQGEDSAGPTMLGFIAILISTAVAAFTATFHKRLTKYTR